MVDAHTSVMNEGAERLRAWRESRNPPWTQEQLARLLGIGQGQISRLETGMVPSFSTAIAIEALTGIEPAAFARRARRRKAS